MKTLLLVTLLLTGCAGSCCDTCANMCGLNGVKSCGDKDGCQCGENCKKPEVPR